MQFLGEIRQIIGSFLGVGASNVKSWAPLAYLANFANQET